MTGYQSKKAAALDEEGMYLVHHTQPAQVKVEGPLHVVCQCDKCKAQPTQRTWVGLTEADLKPMCDKWRIVYGSWVDDFARDIEAKLKERNT